MGSGSSRLGSGRTRVNRRSKFMSSLICGGSSSRAPVEMEDYLDENLMTSAEHSHPVINVVQNTQRGSSLISPARTQFTSSNTETGTSSGSSIAASEDTSAEGGMRNVETSDHGKCLADSKELVSPLLSMALTIQWTRVYLRFVTSQAVRPLKILEILVLMGCLLSLLQAKCLGFLVSNREQDRIDGSVLHVDVVSISSHILSSGSADTSSHASRRNSRRLFWDAFSRRSSRRLNDSPTIVFSTDDTNDLGSQDRWLLDFSSDFLDDGVGGDTGYLGSRIHSLNERRRHSRSEIWERLRAGLDDNRRTSFCPSGLHPDGTCSCESFVMSEESSTRAISRIVMLAEALFEVLDEIHRQPVSLSLSMVSLPAPESVVDSFPLKSHKKVDKAESGDDIEQCYICLAEYEEGDKIRVLPCHHEYHMSCVDKWLKEIHGVCPLCRGDVRQGATEASNSEIPSF
ncbi:hypothetical protein QYF36_009746 [Acer negundo]|nr:hypothetical protein QYF36_009746 [Acer negundo]